MPARLFSRRPAPPAGNLVSDADSGGKKLCLGKPSVVITVHFAELRDIDAPALTI
jgi:hypothetical protein